MIEQDILKYCYFYNEEALPPFDQNDGRRLLWLAEKWICEEGNDLIKPTDPQKSMALFVEAYVGKWAPFEVSSIMELYSAKLNY